jgi:type VI secretion system secreted protein VgrG
VKLHFHWDRLGKKDENSSCWVRVSYPWAGQGWGAVAIPRIGQEVIVAFLEGDPDQPIIVGRVYNAQQVPPYTLPDNMTHSGIKSRSTKGGTAENFNEIRMQDLKGSELLYIHAEKDQTITVEHDRSDSVGHDESRSIENDRSDNVGNNEIRSVGKDQKISIGANRTETVEKNETITVNGNRTESVAGNESIDVDKDRKITIGGDEVQKIAKERKVDVSDNDTLKVGKKLMITAADEITLKAGDAIIQLKKDGTIVIKGKDIKIQASGKISAKASSDITLKGSQVKQN